MIKAEVETSSDIEKITGHLEVEGETYNIISELSSIIYQVTTKLSKEIPVPVKNLIYLSAQFAIDLLKKSPDTAANVDNGVIKEEE